MSTSLKVRGIDSSKHKSAEFAILSLYLPGRNNAGELVYTLFKCEIYLVDGLQANLLIGNDILSPEHLIINIGKKTALLRSCGVTIEVNTKQ